jgi:23S rRNA G2445 N2-methylase RlmL
MPGVEKIAWLEIRDRFPQASFSEFLFAKDQNGIIAFEFPGRATELLNLRTTEDIFVQIASIDKLSRDWRDLRTIARRIERTPLLDQAIKMWPKARGRVNYRVISRKMGGHQYRRMDFEEAVVKGLQRRFRNQWKHVEDARPRSSQVDVEIWANILGSRLLCGLRLSDYSMRHRSYQVVNLPASLRPSVAAAMVLLTDPDPNDVFMDPMCGSGTLMSERALIAPYHQTLGGDILSTCVQATHRNLTHTQKSFTVYNWNACQLPCASNTIDKIAVNLPFGKQIGSRSEIERLYPCAFAEMARILKPGGKAVVLSSEYELVKDTIRQFRTLTNIRGYSIAVLGQWARLYIVKKNED